MSTDKHNALFDRLVMEEADGSARRFAGMLAYAEFKIQKRRFIENFANENSAPPSEKDINNFLLTFDDHKCEALKNEAIDALVGFSEDVMIEQYNENVQGEIERSVLSEVKRQHSWSKNFVISLSAAVFFSVAAYFLLAAASVSNPNSNTSKLFKALLSDDIKIEIVNPNSNLPPLVD